MLLSPLKVAVVYLCTRLFVNLTQAYVPLYLQVTLRLPSSYIATVPLFMFLVGFATSTVMKFMNRKMGRKMTFLMGCAFGKF
jgi:Na+/melibiose symporter-like transporter